MKRFMKLTSTLIFIVAVMLSRWGYAEPLFEPAPVSSEATLSSQTDNIDENRPFEVGDRIKVTIYPEDEYLKGGEMQISSDGNITLPLIGKYAIVGKTILEASRELAKLIDADYLVDPEVVIEVLTVRIEKINLSVLGSVRKPGNFEIVSKEEKVTLLQAILQAGGFSDVANIKKVKIIRKSAGQNQVIEVNAEDIISGNQEDLEVQSEDIIHVSESMF